MSPHTRCLLALLAASCATAGPVMAEPASVATRTAYLPTAVRSARPQRVDSPTLLGEARNVIVFVGDGMGDAHVAATGLYLYGRPGMLPFESFPHRALVSTHGLDGGVTDSAAAGTAMWTGVKVTDGVVSTELPGDGSELPTILERMKARGKRTGLVTTAFLTDATPATLGAHDPSRLSVDAIAHDYLTQTRPDVLLGGGGHGLSAADAAGAGYTVVESRSSLAAVDPARVGRLAGLFGVGPMPSSYDGLGSAPALSEMTRTAIDVLDRSRHGFFLMVEDEGIDSASHKNDLRRAVHGVIHLSEAVTAAVDWAARDGDTLIVVVADHETGGLSVVRGHGPGRYPDVAWSSDEHTNRRVTAYAVGPGSGRVSGRFDNTSLGAVLLR